jgi:hypothetical protein
MEVEEAIEAQASTRAVVVEACMKREAYAPGRAGEAADMLRVWLEAKVRAGEIAVQRPYRLPLDLPFSDIFEYVTLSMRASDPTACFLRNGTSTTTERLRVT